MKKGKYRYLGGGRHESFFKILEEAERRSEDGGELVNIVIDRITTNTYLQKDVDSKIGYKGILKKDYKKWLEDGGKENDKKWKDEEWDEQDEDDNGVDE